MHLAWPMTGIRGVMMIKHDAVVVMPCNGFTIQRVDKTSKSNEESNKLEEEIWGLFGEIEAETDEHEKTVIRERIWRLAATGDKEG